MAIASLVARNGIGSWGDIAHLITRGLDLGAVAPIWTPTTPVSTSWTLTTPGSDGWVPATPSINIWTPQ